MRILDYIHLSKKNNNNLISHRLKIKSRFEGFDLSILAIVLTLCLFGLLAVFWAGMSPDFSTPFVLLKNKVVFILAGICVSLGISHIDYHFYERRFFLILVSLASIICLILVLFFGHKEAGFLLRFKIFKQSFQPTEYCKILIVLILSHTITYTYRRKTKNYLFLSAHSFILGILALLIILQPDLGALMLIGAIGLSMLIAARIHIIKPISLICSLMLATGSGFFLICSLWLKDFYGYDRMRKFFKCLSVFKCNEFQMKSAYMCTVSGKFFGNNIMNSIHVHGLLPMECNDFIFCVIAEEMGFHGVVILILLYIFFMQRGFSIAKDCKDFTGQLMAFGLTWMIAFQALLNILIAVGLFPVTGFTLPFVSQGGNSLMAAMTAVGILLNISRNTFEV